jgi:hypothetical protein
LILLAIAAALLAILGPQLGFAEAARCVLFGLAAAGALLGGVSYLAGQGSPHWRKVNIINPSNRRIRGLKLKKVNPDGPSAGPFDIDKNGDFLHLEKPYPTPFDTSVKEIQVTFDYEDAGGALHPVTIVAAIPTSPLNDFVDELMITVMGPDPSPSAPAPYCAMTLLLHGQDTNDPLVPLDQTHPLP